jgi:hypothetical protein
MPDSHFTDFPILRIIDSHLKNGALIEMRGDKVCLIRGDGEVIGRGDTLQKLLTELIFVLC